MRKANCYKVLSGNRSLLVCIFHVNAPAHAVNRIVAEPILNPETGPILSPETGPVLSPDFGAIFWKAGPKSSPDSGPKIGTGFRSQNGTGNFIDKLQNLDIFGPDSGFDSQQI